MSYQNKFDLLICVSCFIFCFVWTIHAQNLDSLIAHSIEFAKNQLAKSVTEVGDTTCFPRSTVEDGSWSTEDPVKWISGYFPGCLWYMYEKTFDETWRNWAESWTASLEEQKYNTRTLNVGGIIFCSYGNGYRLTGNEAYREVIITTAQSYATRYDSTVGCLKSWDHNGLGDWLVIIDSMPVLEMLFWASKQPGGNTEWYDMAVSHALKTMENHVRDDGSTYHVVDYNPNTGEVNSKKTSQGYSDESTWARGQSWGLYGFTMTYRETGDIRFLETAKKLADYYIEHLPDDHVPYWDFNTPNIPNEEKDASSAAIAVSGLLELSTLVIESGEKEKYRNAAYEILISLCSSNYLAEGTKSSGILLHGVGNYPKNKEIDVTLIYADYYFIEAMLRYEKIVDSSISYDGRISLIPNTIQLFQNYPNPFNSKTIIEYFLAFPNNVSLQVYDINGRLIETLCEGFQEMGEHRFCFNGELLPSGSYFLLLKAGSKVGKKKMLLVR